MEAKEVHPLVTLLLERAKSHPEEFEDDYPDVGCDEDDQTTVRGRWQHAIAEVYNHGSDQDEKALREGMRIIRLDKAHKWALDELLNGDERRAEFKRKQETRKAMQARQLMQTYASVKQNAASSLMGATIPIHSGGNYANTLSAASTLRVGNKTIDESFLSTVRKKLGI